MPETTEPRWGPTVTLWLAQALVAGFLLGGVGIFLAWVCTRKMGWGLYGLLWVPMSLVALVIAWAIVRYRLRCAAGAAARDEALRTLVRLRWLGGIGFLAMLGCVGGYFALADLYVITVRNEADSPLTDIQLKMKVPARFPDLPPGNSARHWVRVEGGAGIALHVRCRHKAIAVPLEYYVVNGQGGRPVIVTITATREAQVRYPFGGKQPSYVAISP